jgi:hypothetical protein
MCGVFETMPAVKVVDVRRRGFAQRAELAAGEAKAFGQGRHKLAAVIDNCGDGRFAQPVGKAEDAIEFGGALIAAAIEAVTDFGDLQRLEDREAIFERAGHRRLRVLAVWGF